MGGTWHWGNVAEPRGPTRAPAWRGGDTWLLFIFIIYMIYNVYRSPDYWETSLLPLITAARYKPVGFPKFTQCGTNPLISGKIDSWIKGAMKIARRSRGRKVHVSLIKHMRKRLLK